MRIFKKSLHTNIFLAKKIVHLIFILYLANVLVQTRSNKPFITTTMKKRYMIPTFFVATIATFIACDKDLVDYQSPQPELKQHEVHFIEGIVDSRL